MNEHKPVRLSTAKVLREQKQLAGRKSRGSIALLEPVLTTRPAPAGPGTSARATLTKPSYQKGLVDLGSGLYAYLQPDGGWGWSNSGLIVDGAESLLVDTLFDERLTGEMLARVRDATGLKPQECTSC